jgi:hypothetical protein
VVDRVFQPDRDGSKIPTDQDFNAMLDEMTELLWFLRKNHSAARARAKLPVRDGYPTRSMPESDIAGGRTADPTADYVASLAGGKYDSSTEMAVSDDHWKDPADPIANHIRNMNREAFDARNRLRSASASLRSAMPQLIKVDQPREQCVSCGVPKSIATQHGKNPRGWVEVEARCDGCSRRLKRNAKSTATTGT